MRTHNCLSVGCLKSVIVFTLCELLFCGCSKKVSVDNDEQSFDLSGTFDKVLFSSVVDSVSYVEFEMTEESLIGIVGRVLFANNKYFIQDITSKSILVFDCSGKYLHKLSKYGQGPGEYIGMEAFCVDEEDNIYVLDTSLKRILKYNIQGEFIEEVCNIEDLPRSDIGYVNGQFLLCMPDYNNDQFRRGIFLLDPKTNKYNQIVKIEKKEGVLLQWYFQFNGQNSSTYYALNNYDDLFYKIKDDKVISARKITVMPKRDEATNEGYELVSCVETSKWDVMVGGSTQNSKYIFYNRETGECKICDMDKLINDIDGAGVGFPLPIVFGNSIATLIMESEDTENPQLQIWHLK